MANGDNRMLEGMFRVGSRVWAPYITRPIAATITEIIVHTDGRMYAKCADSSGSEKAWFALEELRERSR